jgi:uncharacterized protein
VEHPLVAWDQFGVLLLPLPLIAAANLHERPPAGWNAAAVSRVRSAFWLLLAVVPTSTVAFGLLSFGSPTAALILVVTGLTAALLLMHPIRAAIARAIPIDPASALDATALVLSTVLVGSQLASQTASDLLAEQARSGVPLGPTDLVVQEVPFLLAAVLGVGLFIRRTAPAATARLGVERPTGWQVVLALAAAGAFYAFGIGMDALSHLLTPDLAGKVDAANHRLFGQLDDPLGIATIALSAGICEELLFRGALQPRLGVLWTSLVFAAIHTQYGLSLDTVAVFILAIGLGMLRRIANTTTSTICHVAYNALVGVTVSGAWLVPALGLEIALVLGGLTAFFTGRLGNLRTAP